MFRSKNMSDVQIINRVLSGKRDAFGILVKRYLVYVHTMAYARVGNHTDAEDVAQETFLQAFNSLDTLREPSKFSSWLAGITRNIAGKLLRKQGREAAFDPQNGLDAVAKSPDIAKREMQELLRRNLAELGDTQREILLLYYFTGMDTREIAKHLNISADAAEKRLQRARQTLGQKLVASISDTLAPGKPKSEQSKNIMCAIGISPGAGLGLGGAAATGGALTLKNTVMALATIAAVIAGTVAVKQHMSSNEVITSTPVRISNTSNAQPENVPALAAAKAQPIEDIEVNDVKPDDIQSTDSWEINLHMGNVTFEGEVRDESGAVAPNTPVEMTCIEFDFNIQDYVSTRQYRVITDTEGRFSFLGLQVSRLYILCAYTEDTCAWTMVYARPTLHKKNNTLMLEPSGTIAGVVLNAEGKPVPNATIAAKCDISGTWANELGYMGASAMIAKSDESGAFRLMHLPRTEWKLCVRALGYSVVESDFISCDTKNKILTLGDGGSISGRVILEETSKPVPEARVVVTDVSSSGRLLADCDSDGNFTIKGLKDSEYSVIPISNSYVYSELPAVAKVSWGRGPSDLELQMTRPATVSGHVYDAKTVGGIEGIEVWGTLWPNTRNIVKTDKEGRYKIGNVVGKCQISLRLRGEEYDSWKQVTRRNVLLKSGQKMTDINFTLNRGPLVKGIVQDESGNPIAGACVMEGSISSISGKDGTFAVFSNSPTEDIKILISREEYAHQSIPPMKISEEGLEKVVVVMKPESSLSGTILDFNGKPVFGVTINADPVYVEDTSYPRWTFEGKTNSQGKFHIKNMCAGEYNLSLNMPGMSYRSKEPPQMVKLGYAQHVTDYIFQMGDEGLAISGRITYKNDMPVAGMPIGATTLAGSGVNSGSITVTDGDGNYRVKYLKKGHHDVYIGGNGMNRKVIGRAYAGESDCDFKIDHPGSASNAPGIVKGRVSRADTGEPLEEYELFLQRDYMLVLTCIC